MKKIILTSNILWTITQFRKDLIKHLKNDYEIICIADDDEFSDASLDVINKLGVKFIKIKVDRKGMNPVRDIFYMYSLYKVYKNIKPDLVIHYTIKPNIYGSLVASMLKMKSFAVVSGLGSSLMQDNLLSKIIKFLYKVALRGSSKVLFLNQDDMDIFLTTKIIQQEKALLLPGEGVDINHYKLCEKVKISENKITFLMIARLLKDKGIYEYIEAIKKIKNDKVEFLLAGVLDKGNPTSIKEEELQGWIKDGIVRYLGKTDDIKEFLKLADVIVLPSYREGLSRVLLEACSCEKFIITSDIAGCKELCIDGENGYLCNPKDINSLFISLEKTIALGQEKLQQQGKIGRTLMIKSFSSEIVNNIYTKLIKETI